VPFSEISYDHRLASVTISDFGSLGIGVKAPKIWGDSISRRNHGFNGSKTDFHGLIRPDPS
jgi:hypothetical protein